MHLQKKKLREKINEEFEERVFAIVETLPKKLSLFPKKITKFPT